MYNAVLEDVEGAEQVFMLSCAYLIKFNAIKTQWAAIYVVVL
jgi:hypothetical protein